MIRRSARYNFFTEDLGGEAALDPLSAVGAFLVDLLRLPHLILKLLVVRQALHDTPPVLER